MRYSRDWNRKNSFNSARILDLFTEFRCLTNGQQTLCGNGLLGALAHCGLGGLQAVEKDEMQQLAIRGGPFSDQERSDLADYCESDVVALDQLLAAMLPNIDMPRALLQDSWYSSSGSESATTPPPAWM